LSNLFFILSHIHEKGNCVLQKSGFDDSDKGDFGFDDNGKGLLTRRKRITSSSHVIYYLAKISNTIELS